MDPKHIEDQIIRSSRIEGWVAIVSLIAAAVGYLFVPQFRGFIGWAGLIVWGIYALLYLFQVGHGRSWLGAFLPGAVAFFFSTWAIGG
jgi:hypothetical protein|nr:hypothetical protein [Comamonas thiooxydans]